MENVLKLKIILKLKKIKKRCRFYFRLFQYSNIDQIRIFSVGLILINPDIIILVWCSLTGSHSWDYHSLFRAFHSNPINIHLTISPVQHSSLYKVQQCLEFLVISSLMKCWQLDQDNSLFPWIRLVNPSGSSFDQNLECRV